MGWTDLSEVDGLQWGGRTLVGWGGQTSVRWGGQTSVK